MRLPKIEVLIIGIFFISVALWAVNRCSSKRGSEGRTMRTYTDPDEDRPVRHDTVFMPQPGAAVQQPQQAPTQQQPLNINAPSATPPAGAAPPQQQPVRPSLQGPSNTPPPTATNAAPANGSRYSTLFVTIDGLKVRKTPGLKGDVVAKLKLEEQVYFLNEKTEWTQELSLGYEKVTDHWVKIRTKSGKEGWVFGAGVHYYKMKRKGTL